MGRLWGVVLGVLVLAGCAGTVQHQAVVVPEGVPVARVQVARESGVYGAGLSALVTVNGVVIGELGPGGKLATAVPAGPVAVGAGKADARFVAAPGGVYFVEVAFDGLFWWLRPGFDAWQIDGERARVLGLR